MGYIYKITNTQEDKVYIGQTTSPLSVRLSQHLTKAKIELNCKFKLLEAIRHFGRECFSIELLGEYPDCDLDKEETKAILKYDSIENGYNHNLTQGNKSIIGLNNDKLIEFDSIGDAARFVREEGLSQAKDLRSIKSNISSAIQGKNYHKTAYGYEWRYNTV